MNTASKISQREAYRLMLKDYPDVMSIEQMCELLGISTKTGYRILREGKICCLKVGRAYRIPKAHLFYLSLHRLCEISMTQFFGHKKFTKKCVRTSSILNPVLV